MHSYVDLYFTPESLTPREIAERLRKATGLDFIIGPHDLAFEWRTEEEFHERIGLVHTALKGTGVFYRIETVSDDPRYVEPVPWPPPLPQRDPVHPAY